MRLRRHARPRRPAALAPRRRAGPQDERRDRLPRPGRGADRGGRPVRHLVPPPLDRRRRARPPAVRLPRRTRDRGGQRRDLQPRRAPGRAEDAVPVHQRLRLRGAAAALPGARRRDAGRPPRHGRAGRVGPPAAAAPARARSLRHQAALPRPGRTSPAVRVGGQGADDPPGLSARVRLGRRARRSVAGPGSRGHLVAPALLLPRHRAPAGRVHGRSSSAAARGRAAPLLDSAARGKLHLAASSGGPSAAGSPPTAISCATRSAAA